MKLLNRLVSPSISRSIIYPLVAAGCMYVGTMGPSKEYALLQNQRQEAILSNTNLARVLDI